MRARHLSVAFYTRSEPLADALGDGSGDPELGEPDASPVPPGAVSVPLADIKAPPADVSKLLQQSQAPERRALQQLVAAHDQDDDE